MAISFMKNKLINYKLLVGNTAGWNGSTAVDYLAVEGTGTV